MRALVVALALLGAEPARAWCGLACDTEWSGAAAAERLARVLGPLPEGTEVVGLLEGGFQDVYIQARLSVDRAGLVEVLDALHLGKSDLAREEVPYFGPEGPEWFDWERQDGLLLGLGRTDWRPDIAVGVARDPDIPDRWRVYLWGFVT